MNKKMIIILSVVALLVLGGVGFALFSGGDETNTNTDNQEPAAANESQQDGPNVNVVEESYVMEVTTTSMDGSQSVASITVEDSDTYRVVVEGEDGGEFIYDGDTFYTKATNDEQYSAFDLSEFNTDLGTSFATAYLQDQDLIGIYSSADFVGTQSCAAGTCDVYEYTDPETGDQATVKIADGRISEIESTNPDSGETVSVVYRYDESVDIQIPTDAETIEIPSNF